MVLRYWPTAWLKLNRGMTSSMGEEMERLEQSHTGGRSFTWHNHPLWYCLLKSNPWQFSISTPSYTPKRKACMCPQNDLDPKIFVAALFINTPKWDITWCPHRKTDESVVVYIYIYIYTYIYKCCGKSFHMYGGDSLVAKLCPILSDPMDCSPPGSSVHGDFPGKNTGMGCHFIL